jgi:CRISPR-associated endonuclease/helicase Cas3
VSTASSNGAIAHLGPDGKHHSLEEHLQDVSNLAAKFAEPWGGGEEARCAGIWHDLGKYRAAFQDYLAAHERASAENAHCEGEAAVAPAKGTVDHSSAGAVLAFERLGPKGVPIALAIAGHHSGLRDWRDVRDRLAKNAALLNDAMLGNPARAVLEHEPNFEARVMKDACALRRLEFGTRMMFSALVDADFLDTEEFFDASRQAARGHTVSLAELGGRLTAFLDVKEQSMSGQTGKSGDVAAARRLVRQDSIACGVRSVPGVFSLTVPTGGGKTLAGMEFALHHAVTHGLKRVIVAIPFTSIVEQTSKVYQEAFGLDPEDDGVIIEHHSAFEPSKEATRSKLATENWDAPIVVTTTVQLLESLFARKTSRCRKLHNLAESVIILDEAQTLPRGLLACSIEALQTLAAEYRTTIVISTATQPALLKEHLASSRDPDIGFESATEISSAPLALFDQLKRVEVQWPSDVTTATTYDDLARELAAEPDLLAIVHKRADARALTEKLDALLGHRQSIHLSALMLPSHRSRIIAEVKRKKAAGETVRLVATQLVEAGVDLDFALVYRALGGLDALAQAAGRCNREGKLDGLGQLRVFVAETNPPPGIATQAMQTTQVMLRADPNLDLFAPATALEYFKRLYSSGSTDEFGIQKLRENLCFEQVAAVYSIVDDGWSESVVVPLDGAVKVIAELRALGPSRRLLRKLGRFSVNVSKKDMGTWIAQGFAEKIAESVNVLHSAHAYSERYGLLVDQVMTFEPEALVT